MNGREVVMNIEAVREWFESLPPYERKMFNNVTEQLDSIFEVAVQDNWSPQETLWFIQNHLQVDQYDLIDKSLHFGLSLPVVSSEENQRFIDELERNRRNRENTVKPT